MTPSGDTPMKALLQDARGITMRLGNGHGGVVWAVCVSPLSRLWPPLSNVAEEQDEVLGFSMQACKALLAHSLASSPLTFLVSCSSSPKSSDEIATRRRLCSGPRAFGAPIHGAGRCGRRRTASGRGSTQRELGVEACPACVRAPRSPVLAGPAAQGRHN